MSSARRWLGPAAVAVVSLTLHGCADAPQGNSSAGGATTATNPNGSSASGGATVQVSSRDHDAGGSRATETESATSGGTRASGGSKDSASTEATGGIRSTSSARTSSNQVGRGGSTPTSGTSGGATSGGATSGGATSRDTTQIPSAACSEGTWPAADPAATGPFATVTEENVGPQAGSAEEGGTPPQFTLFRPKDLSQAGLCHPVVTWGNGTGATPSMYKALLGTLASHGFVVIASNSTNVADGNPAPMVAGVTWVLEQNADPASTLFGRIDAKHIGATGHSQGGFATTTAAADSRIGAIAPICGAMTQRNLHGPALLLCGGMDDMVPCDEMIQTAFNGISNQPVMLANYLSADHGNWLSFRTGTLSPIETAVVAWMRVHLMNDVALRPRFYGASCTLCQDSAWKISQKSMDE